MTIEYKYNTYHVLKRNLKRSNEKIIVSIDRISIIYEDLDKEETIDMIYLEFCRLFAAFVVEDTPIFYIFSFQKECKYGILTK